MKRKIEIVIKKERRERKRKNSNRKNDKRHLEKKDCRADKKRHLVKGKKETRWEEEREKRKERE